MKLGRPSSGQYRIAGRHRITQEFADLALRRVMPFLDTSSIQTRPLSLVMSEVYLQGIRDAVDAMEGRSEPPTSSV